MGTRATFIEIKDFSGGLNSNDAEFLVPINQAVSLQNITLLERGFRKRYGNSAFNSSAMVGGSTAIAGLGYMQFNSGVEFLNAVAGTKFFTSTGLTGTMADNTGALSITSGKDNLWTPVQFNDLQIWFGGAPDAPFKYSGSGNAVALGGTPPSARTAFVAANRVFAISTSANPSIIQWCTLANPEDWTGAGSGTQEVNKNDGEELLFGVPLDADTAILFKNSSTHLMPLTKSPFPVYTLQTKEGAVGRNAWVLVNGTIYFINPSLRMMATNDGKNFVDFPDSVNDLWDSANTERVKYIRGQYFPTEMQIHWFLSTGSSVTNDIVIIWDLRKKCWLYNPTGFKANTSCLARNRRYFTGHYDGKVYEQNLSSTFLDASEGGSFIDAFWQTPSMRLSSLDGLIVPQWIDVIALAETSGNLTISYGFNFQTDQKNAQVSIVSSGDRWDSGLWDVATWGGQTSTRKRLWTKGRGENFNIKIRNNSSTKGFTIQAVSAKVTYGRNVKVVSEAA